jgi:hypothetical protein
VGCSKERPVKLTEEQKRNLFEISSLESMQITATTQSTSGDAITSIEHHGILRADSQVSKFPVTHTEASDDRLKALFKGLQIEGFPGNPFKIELEVNKSWVIAYKVITSKKQEETLGSFEQSIYWNQSSFQVPTAEKLSVIKLSSSDLYFLIPLKNEAHIDLNSFCFS